jgi:hypothetical protein
MSIATTPVPTRRTVRATAEWMLTVHLFIAACFWGIAIVVLTLVIVIIDQVGAASTSVVAFSRQAAIWLPFSMFIGVTAAYLPVHVASGLTRRVLSLGALVAAVVTGLVNGVVFAVLLVIERAVFGALGWEWNVVDDVVWSGAEVPEFFVASCFTFVVAYVSGLLVCLTYQRLGGWWATLALPLTAGPIFVVSALFSQNTGPFATAGWLGGGQPVVVAVTGSVLIGATMAFVFDRLTRGVPVPSRTS